VINSHAELRERELIKLAALAAALAGGLHRRGVAEPDASLAAEAGIVVLRVAFERWTQPAQDGEPSGMPASAGAEEAGLGRMMREALERLTDVTAER
jgi:hypothetical protein